MRYAVLSDIHGNLEALDEALAYLEKENVQNYLVLGDSIGYGASPNECLERIDVRKGKAVAGNHEQAVFDEVLASCFNEYAYAAVVWTREAVDRKWHPYLKNLPLVIVDKEFSIAHGSFHEPERFDYLFTMEDAWPSFECLGTPLGWIGHTHVPQIFVKTKGDTYYLREGVYTLERGEIYLINPGSIGQPRDRDPRLSFALFDDEKYELKLLRLPYDNKRAAEKIRMAGLPRYLADRLL
jgi:predicted phosphodiesterase